jgi:predicted RNase H-like HicB family nuclease
MKRTYLCLFAKEHEVGGYSVFVPDLPGCYSSGDDLPNAREMASEVMDISIAETLKSGEPIPEPKMSTFAEALEWFRELMSYELEGETEEDRAFNEDDLHIEMIEVEAPVAKATAR